MRITIPKLIAAELRRLTSTRMATVALVALMCVPVLYGGLYLWANQDPYGKLHDVPVALVNQDVGSMASDGKTENLGDRVVAQIVKDGTFDWHPVSAASAQDGVGNGTYDFSVTIPSDFSAALYSGGTNTPRTATVMLTTNDANSYLASTIGKQTVETLRASISKQVNEHAITQFLVALSSIRSGLQSATTGAGELADGTSQLSTAAATAQTGASELAGGSARLARGAGELADGTATLATGAQRLSSGLGTLQTATAALPEQTQALADGARQVADGDRQIAATADQAGSAAQQLAAAVPTARAQILTQLSSAGLTPAQLNAVMGRLDQLGGAITSANQQVQQKVSRINQLAGGADQVAAGAQTLAANTPALTAGIASAAGGAQQLSSGAASAADGAAQLDSGADELADGSAQLRSGLTRLHDGAVKVDQGARTLDGKLRDAVSEIPAHTTSQQAAIARTIADPVTVDTGDVATAGTYGAGLAPFFASLAGWIGIYALFLIVKPVSKRAITALQRPVRITLAGWLTPGILGAIQMIALFFVLFAVLGFSVDQPLAVYGLMVLASLTYASIVLALNVWLGSVGQFLGLLLMVLQLVTAGGTFPWQTLPGPLMALHRVLPMGFVTDGLRQLMYGGRASLAGHDALVLTAWLLGAVILAGIGVARMTRHRTLRDLEPSLIG